MANEKHSGTPAPTVADLQAPEAAGHDVRGGGGAQLVAQAPTSTQEAEQIRVNLEKSAAARMAAWRAMTDAFRG